jgi:hypothetical protein
MWIPKLLLGLLPFLLECWCYGGTVTPITVKCTGPADRRHSTGAMTDRDSPRNFPTVS